MRHRLYQALLCAVVVGLAAGCSDESVDVEMDESLGDARCVKPFLLAVGFKGVDISLSRVCSAEGESIWGLRYAETVAQTPIALELRSTDFPDDPKLGPAILCRISDGMSLEDVQVLRGPVAERLVEAATADAERAAALTLEAKITLRDHLETSPCPAP